MRLPFTNVQCHSPVSHRERCDCLSQNAVQCHSLAVGHRKRQYDQAAFHKMCNVTHKLLVIGKDVIKLPFTKCAMSLTPIGHRKRCDGTAFHKCAMSRLTSCWS